MPLWTSALARGDSRRLDRRRWPHVPSSATLGPDNANIDVPYGREPFTFGPEVPVYVAAQRPVFLSRDRMEQGVVCLGRTGWGPDIQEIAAMCPNRARGCCLSRRHRAELPQSEVRRIYKDLQPSVLI